MPMYICKFSNCFRNALFQVVELISKDGGSVQVSLWIRQLDNDGPCLVVAEPVNCKNVVVSFTNSDTPLKKKLTQIGFLINGH